MSSLTLDVICEKIHDAHGPRWERGGICVACVAEMMDRTDVSVRAVLFRSIKINKIHLCLSSAAVWRFMTDDAPAGGAQARGARVRDARGRGSGAAVLRRTTKNTLHLIIIE